MFLSKQGFRPESEIPSRHPSSSLVYIGKFLKLKYTVSVPEKISISWSGAAWNRWVMMTRLLLTPASKRCYWLEKRKTENPRRVRLSWFSDTYCIVILRYFLRCVLSVTFCGAAVLKVMDQKTLDKRRWSHKARITVYIQTLGEFARHVFTNLWFEKIFEGG